MRTRARQDRNQGEIVRALEKLGATVEPIRSLRGGVPDLLVGYRGKNYLIEIKAGKEGRLSESQKNWRDKWQGGKPFVVRSIDDVIIWQSLIDISWNTFKTGVTK